MANDVTRYNDRSGRRDLSLFDAFFDSMLGAWGAWDNYSARVPAVDVEETDKEFIIKAEMPGFNENNVKITVDKHVLHITGEVDESEKDKDGKRYLIKERRHSSFERSFSLPEGLDESLPEGLDESAISASFENGILTVTLPKTPEEQPKRIEVKIGK